MKIRDYNSAVGGVIRIETTFYIFKWPGNFLFDGSRKFYGEICFSIINI